ncbi:hypothetical protein CRP01_15445 [Flavilitoribacter nigricans DSM 23189 = NBRC 102662]|uniref:Uncharacterized protein n=1 Tax=Flavilitoribacter nigricans (strain ATCC 23147 / DSM 23189 / NBRC 102662 / NCIMB 1420 / SS-2) TaxID=1122177 RepID=A0A2D0NBX0_FLAN2|nr:hypothetical protein CRP01_15445 [Flavilitoribacter nigricans DSM 23189 = NBRC 102662]
MLKQIFLKEVIVKLRGFAAFAVKTSFINFNCSTLQVDRENTTGRTVIRKKGKHPKTFSLSVWW